MLAFEPLVSVPVSASVSASASLSVPVSVCYMSVHYVSVSVFSDLLLFSLLSVCLYLCISVSPPPWASTYRLFSVHFIASERVTAEEATQDTDGAFKQVNVHVLVQVEIVGDPVARLL